MPHGALLVAFVEATMAADLEAVANARGQLRQVLGWAGVVDASAVTAMFQLNTRAADAAGIPIEEPTREGRSSLGVHLDFEARADGQAP